MATGVRVKLREGSVLEMERRELFHKASPEYVKRDKGKNGNGGIGL